MEKKKIAFIGAGSMAQIVFRAYLSGLLPDYEIAGIMERSPERAAIWAEKTGASDCAGLDEILALEPDYVIEMASVAAAKENILPVLEKGISFIILSVGALADGAFREKVTETAEKNQAKVLIPSGSIGGFDAIQTIALMGADSAELSMRKGPDTLKGTKIYTDEMYDFEETRLVFDGNAQEAIDAMPTKINIGVAAALAGVGTENMRIRMYCDPEMYDDDITVTVKSEDASCQLKYYSKPSDVAGWSVAALLRNLASPVQFM